MDVLESLQYDMDQTTTYNCPFSAESVDTEDALKAGQVVEPCRERQVNAMAVGALRMAKMQNKIILLDGHVLLCRKLPINWGCAFIALQTSNDAGQNKPNGTTHPFNRQTTQSCKSFKVKRCSGA